MYCIVLYCIVLYCIVLYCIIIFIISNSYRYIYIYTPSYRKIWVVVKHLHFGAMQIPFGKPQLSSRALQRNPVPRRPGLQLCRQCGRGARPIFFLFGKNLNPQVTRKRCFLGGKKVIVILLPITNSWFTSGWLDPLRVCLHFEAATLGYHGDSFESA